MGKGAAAPSRVPSWQQALLTMLLFAFLAGGLFAGYLFYSTVRDIVAHAQFTLLPNWPHAQLGRNPDDQLPQWEKRERVNILILGIDQRRNDPGPWRTDTMILATVDPASKTAAMLSIPRDLWVTIPGYGENRINTAHFLGQKDNYPGGGPALAKKTVQYTLGVPVHYYVRLNFDGFEKLIDTIGGIDINVERAIHDEQYPDENYGYMTVDIPAGFQHMDGKTALQYARSRHGGSDFERSRRQQQVILAVRDKVLSLNIPLTKIPEVLRLLGSSVQTDLNLDEMYRLAQLLREIDQENIESAFIDQNMTTPTVTPEGWAVLIPQKEKVRELVSRLFSSTAPESVPGQNQLAAEAATIEVQNGTQTAGLAQRTYEYLKQVGYNVVAFSNADRSDYPKTVIVDYTGKHYTVSALAALFAVEPENIRHSPDVPSGVDIRLILGQDYADKVLSAP
ncbi:MAG: LCP family protein [Chloroflexi bacterium]|nr:LCP family protein [Chloroflexota bacterium]